MVKNAVLKTTVYLDEDILLILRGLADAEKRSQADIIREALQRYLRQIQSPNPKLPESIGRYHSGRSDISQRVEELFRQAVRQEHAGADREQANHVSKTGPIKQSPTKL